MPRKANVLRRVLLATLLATTVSGLARAQAPGGDVDQQFAALKGSFSTASKSFGDAAISTWAVPSAYVSKKFIGRSVSKGVANAGVTVAVSVPGHGFPAPFSKVTTASIDPIPCDADKLMGCNSDCHLDLGCALAKGACELAKATAKGLCETKKTAQAAISDKIILTVYLYDIDTGSSDTVWISGTASAALSGVDLADDLKRATLITNVAASAQVSTKVKLVFEPVLKALLILLTADPTCILDEELTVKDQPVGFDQQDLHLPISLSDPYVKDGKVTLDLQFEKTTITLRFQRSPVAKLIESDWRNLRNIATCPAIPVLTVTAEELFPNDFMKKDQELPAISQSQSIAAIPAPAVLGQSYTVSLITTDTALGVRADRKP